jgi:transposase
VTYAEFVASISCGRCGCEEPRWSTPTGSRHQAWECRACGAVQVVDVPDDISDDDEGE